MMHAGDAHEMTYEIAEHRLPSGLQWKEVGRLYGRQPVLRARSNHQRRIPRGQGNGFLDFDKSRRIRYNQIMLPFRELEILDTFILDGQECDKVGSDKYLTYDESYEPESLEVADPNLMVELVEEDEEEEEIEYENKFFHSLLNLLDGMEQVGEEMTIKNLRQFAKDFLSMPKD
jgi:hypothetical protein